MEQKSAEDEYSQERSDRKKSEWIKALNVVEVDTNGRICRHALIKVNCSNSSTSYLKCREYSFDVLDHWGVWQRRDGSRFALSHVYIPRQQALEKAKEWAHLHGLIVISDSADAWYGFGSVPLRFEIARGRWATRVGQGDVELFQRLVLEEPALLDLLAEVRAVRDDKSEKGFCANAVWYGYGEFRDRGIKPRLYYLVGWGRGEKTERELLPSPATPADVIERWRREGPRKPPEKPLELKTIGWDEISAPLSPVPDDLLHSEEAYESAYLVLYGMLPPCRMGPRCGCAWTAPPPST